MLPDQVYAVYAGASAGRTRRDLLFAIKEDACANCCDTKPQSAAWLFETAV